MTVGDLTDNFQISETAEALATLRSRREVKPVAGTLEGLSLHGSQKKLVNGVAPATAQ